MVPQHFHQALKLTLLLTVGLGRAMETRLTAVKMIRPALHLWQDAAAF